MMEKWEEIREETYKKLVECNEEAMSLQHEIIQKQKRNIEQLQNWVNDLQADMYINCVYCGHRYGPDNEVPAIMADVLKEHIEICPKHPLFKAKQEVKKLKEELNDYKEGVEGLKLSVGDLRDERDKLEITNQYLNKEIKKLKIM